MPIYHFCVKKYNPNNTVDYYDGITEAVNPILTASDYTELKTNIGKQMPGSPKGKDIILTSFSKLQS